MTVMHDRLVFEMVFKHGVRQASDLLDMKQAAVYKRMNRAGFDLRSWQRNATKLKQRKIKTS